MSLLCPSGCFLFFFFFLQTPVGTYNQLWSWLFILSGLKDNVSEEFNSVWKINETVYKAFLSYFAYRQTFLTQTFHSRSCGRNIMCAKIYHQYSFSQSNSLCSTLAALNKISSFFFHQIKQTSRGELSYLNTRIWSPGGLPGNDVDHISFGIFDVECLDLENKIFLSELLCIS